MTNTTEHAITARWNALINDGTAAELGPYCITILGAVTFGKASTRADIERMTGLSRSTVARYLRHLVNLGFLGVRQVDGIFLGPMMGAP